MKTAEPQDENVHHATVAQLEWLATVLRRRWLVVGSMTALGLTAALVAAASLTPKWQATATLVLHLAGPQVLEKVKSVSDEGGVPGVSYREYYHTQRTILGSRAVAERALDKLGLASDPVLLGIEGLTEAERKEKAPTIDPVERLREWIEVGEIPESRVVTIDATYPDPVIAAQIANAVADAYTEHVRSIRARAGTAAAQTLSEERAKSLQTLRDAEKRLAAFKETRGIASISLADRQNVITQNIITLSLRTKETEAKRIDLDALFAEAQKLRASGNLGAATILSEAETQAFEKLRTEETEAEREFRKTDLDYGPKHEAHRKAQARLELVQAKVDREGTELLESLRARRDATRASHQELGRALAAEQHRALELTLLEREYRELEREAKTAADAYAVVALRDTEIGMANRIEGQSLDETIEILDRATAPSEPAFPPKAWLVALGALVGLFLGGGLAVLIDLRDQRIRSLIDLERRLVAFRLPVLGQLPLIPVDARLGAGNTRAQRRQRDLYTHLYPQSLMAERCRGIRTGLTFTQVREPLRTLMVTSPTSAEGKSSTAVNLALSFCQAGKRVLLVDADMRRPRLHLVFASELSEREDGGLSNLLLGRCSPEAAVDSNLAGLPPELSILCCGPIPSNPAELLEGTHFRRVLQDLSSRFDLVIVDSPPVLPVADPLILARHVDGVVLVARCGSTTLTEITRAITSLQGGDTNLLGVVLNEVDARQQRYGYDLSYYTYGARDPENTGVPSPSS